MLSGIRNGVRRIFKLPSRSRSHVKADVNQELETFLAERVDYLVLRGMSESEAREEALNRLGPSLADASALLQHTAITRERRMHVRDMFDDFMQDLRYAARTLRRDARFSVFAVIIVALGIGASVTVFSVANTLLVRALPFKDADNLMWIQNGMGEGSSLRTIQPYHYRDYRDQNKSFTDIAAYSAFYGVGDAKLQVHDVAMRLSGVRVTQKFFSLLGVQPAIGREFTVEESARGAAPVVMMSDLLWRRQFNSDPQIVGKKITINEFPVTVIGVLPASFDFGSALAPGAHVDFFAPFSINDQTNRSGNQLVLIGRLKPGVTRQVRRPNWRCLPDR